MQGLLGLGATNKLVPVTPISNIILATLAAATRIAVGCMIVVVRAYQVLIRPHLVGSCCYHPTCSEYAIEAIGKCGPLRGGWLTLRRLSRCRPFAHGGFDPVP